MYLGHLDLEAPLVWTVDDALSRADCAAYEANGANPRLRLYRYEAGRALLFQHRILHEATEVRSGTKHVLRTDVLYRRAP